MITLSETGITLYEGGDYVYRESFRTNFQAIHDYLITRAPKDSPVFTKTVTLGQAPVADMEAVNKKFMEDALATLADLLMPTGTVITYAASTPPNGFLKCDGSAVSRETYARLFNTIGLVFGEGDGLTTFRLPDLRGEFIRGYDDGRGLDSERVFGSDQVDAFASHNHIQNAATVYTDVNSRHTGSEAFDAIGPNVGLTTELTGGTETRPKNVALLYCIKY